MGGFTLNLTSIQLISLNLVITSSISDVSSFFCKFDTNYFLSQVKKKKINNIQLTFSEESKYLFRIFYTGEEI